ncbi:MAG: hypothetical protein WBX22_31320 [Silvibacterium sp.]
MSTVNRRIASSVWNNFHHLLHHQGIPDQEADTLRSTVAEFFAQDFTEIESRKLH